MVMIRAYARPENPASVKRRELLAEVRQRQVGGIVLFESDLESIPWLVNDLQDAAPLPLLVAADLENGLAFRVPRGSVSMPSAMALGAAGSVDDARFAGELTAREARAVGIHWTFAPVADLNNNPDNPVINIRSFGEDPEAVGRMVAAYVEGARAGGVMTTAKHFPGHGDTHVDSHFGLPTLSLDRKRLAAVELPPFRAAFRAGVDSVMTGHLAVPSLDAEGHPATLSPAITTGLLREQMGYRGLIVTDALEMAGSGGSWTGQSAVDAVRAGADVVLLPRSTAVAVDSIVRAVREDRITESRLDESVRRILEAKARLGLHLARRVDWVSARHRVGRPKDEMRAADIATRSITVVRNEGDVLPLAVEDDLRLLHLVLPGGQREPHRLGIMESGFAARDVAVTTVHLDCEPRGGFSAERLDEVAAQAAEHSHVVVSSFLRLGTYSGSRLGEALEPLMARLAAGPSPVVLVSFDSPYLLARYPGVQTFVSAFGSAPVSQSAALRALFGEADVSGRMPVSLPGLFDLGDGLRIARRLMSLPSALPEEAGLDSAGLDAVHRLLDDFVAEGAFPGGVLAIGHRGKLADLHAFGRLSNDGPATTPDSIYDLASLTKVVATTTMAMILVDEGRLDLDAPVQNYLPLFLGEGTDGLDKARVTVRQLLTHSSGIDWWAPLYETLRGPQAYFEQIQAMDLVYEPGSETKYSDLGLILLGEILERVAGERLDEFVERRVFEPLGMVDTGFLPSRTLLTPDLLPRIAPTEQDAWRGRMLRGEVHDENAFALGGVAPHAGLFATAGDLARFAQMVLDRGVFEHHRIVSKDIVDLFTNRSDPEGSGRALGWNTKSLEGSSAGTLFSPRSFGHTGFTGTSIWIDPERQLFVILLTNRVHPSRENQLIRKVRPAVADAVVKALAEDPYSPPAPVEVGLDRLQQGETGAFEGKRLGLVVHSASVTAAGQHAIDVFRGQGLDVVRLFTPEHGLRGQAAAGEEVESGFDAAGGLPVVSLYGQTRRPAAEDLADLDALVFDLQGAGVRFYTYVSTLILTLEAAADAGIEFIVLDRPNPLGGERVEGPVSAPRGEVAESFVNLAPGPLVHGLTLGEMARYVNAQRGEPVALRVVPMRGWRREMTWAETGRQWMAPSPNLRSPEAALAYPGVAMLEATNASEGRGTPQPFLFFGAPWLDPARLEGLDVPGFEMRPAEFTPRASAAAPEPKYRDQLCRGFEIVVTDRRAAEPYRLGLEILRTLVEQPGFQWRQGGEGLVRLLGTTEVLEALRAGAPVEELLVADAAVHGQWLEMRRPSLLY